MVTKAKIKRADSANMKGIATNKLHRKLTAKCTPAFSLDRYQQVCAKPQKTDCFTENQTD